MSIRKIFLVASRELMEYVRTKAFWFGILFVPLLIAGSVIVPALLQKAKDARKFAVIDQSGWLLAEVESRARLDDAREILQLVRDDAKKGGESSLVGLPAILRELAPAVEGAKDPQLPGLARTLAGAESLVAEPEGDAAPAEAGLALCRSKSAAFIAWYDGLTPVIAGSISKSLDRAKFHRVLPDARSEDELKAALERGPKELFGYFVIGPDPAAGSEGCKYVSNNSTDGAVRSWLARLATDSVRRQRFSREGVEPSVARRIQDNLVFQDTQIGKEGAETKVSVEDRIRHAAPAVFTYLLWFSIFISAQMLLTNTIEEKSNRLMEVLLSSTSPLDLMIGKTLGTAATGFTMVASWVLLGAGAIMIVPKVMGIDIGIDLGSIVSTGYILSFLGYYVLGYLLYSSVFCAIGSLCDNIKDAQNLMQPVMGVLIMPLFLLIFVAQDPNGTLARVLSFIPPFTPFVMMNRAAGPPATWEYVATFALLIASIFAAFYLSAKIFRIGVLMTGQPPKPMEILRWLKAPVGTTAPIARGDNDTSAG